MQILEIIAVSIAAGFGLRIGWGMPPRCFTACVAFWSGLKRGYLRTSK